MFIVLDYITDHEMSHQPLEFRVQAVFPDMPALRSWTRRNPGRLRIPGSVVRVDGDTAYTVALSAQDLIGDRTATAGDPE